MEGEARWKNEQKESFLCLRYCGPTGCRPSHTNKLPARMTYSSSCRPHSRVAPADAPSVSGRCFGVPNVLICTGTYRRPSDGSSCRGRGRPRANSLDPERCGLPTAAKGRDGRCGRRRGRRGYGITRHLYARRRQSASHLRQAKTSIRTFGPAATSVLQESPFPDADPSGAPWERSGE